LKVAGGTGHRAQATGTAQCMIYYISSKITAYPEERRKIG